MRTALKAATEGLVLCPGGQQMCDFLKDQTILRVMAGVFKVEQSCQCNHHFLKDLLLCKPGRLTQLISFESARKLHRKMSAN